MYDHIDTSCIYGQRILGEDSGSDIEKRNGWNDG